MAHLYIILLFASVCWGSISLPYAVNGTTKIQAVPLKFGTPLPEKDLTGRLVGLSSSQIHGNILISKKITIILDWNLYFLQSKLPLAVILVPDDPFPGADEYILDCWSCASDFQVPFLSINNVDGALLLNYLNETEFIDNVILSFTDNPNEYHDIKESGLWTAGQVIVAAMAVTSVAIGLWKLVTFIKLSGFNFSIAIVVLLILLVASVLQAINWLGDPWFSRRQFAFTFGASFITSPNPFIELAGMLITLYWHELLTLSKIQVSKFLSKLLIPYIVFSIVLIALEYALVITRAFLGASLAILTIIQIIYSLIIIITLAVFYFVTSARLLLYMKEKGLGGKKKLRIQATLTILTAIGFVVRIIGVVIVTYAALVINLPPNYFYPLVWLQAFTNMWISLTIIFSFQPKNKKYVSKYSTISKSQSQSSKA